MIDGGAPTTKEVKPPEPRKPPGSFMDGVRDGIAAGRSARANGARNWAEVLVDWFKRKLGVSTTPAAAAPRAPAPPVKPTGGSHK
jgi:hypothetical protein